jgi:hypothetical protein
VYESFNIKIDPRFAHEQWMAKWRQHHALHTTTITTNAIATTAATATATTATVNETMATTAATMAAMNAFDTPAILTTSTPVEIATDTAAKNTELPTKSQETSPATVPEIDTAFKSPPVCFCHKARFCNCFLFVSILYF